MGGTTSFNLIFLSFGRTLMYSLVAVVNTLTSYYGRSIIYYYLGPRKQ